MKNHQKLIACAGLCLWLATAGRTVVDAADQVTRLSDGATLRGKLTTLSKSRIVLERSNGATEEFTPDDIRDLRFDREPTSLQRVRTNIRGGAFDTALESLEQIRSDYRGTDRRVVTELEFLKARCEAGIAETDPEAAAGAIASLTAFGATHGNDFRSIEATLLLADLLVEQDAERAINLLKQVQQSGLTGFELQAGVTLGDILLRNGNADDALAAFDDVVERSKGNPAAISAYCEGQLGRSRCLRLQSNPDQAVALLDQLIAEVSDERPTVLARAWNCIGDCQRDNNNKKAALMAYLHVDVLYATASAEHAESLYWLATLWKSVGHPERGVDARSRLQTQYANSQWAQRAGNE
jgi:predicted negative regulator of RcsB-dependent stress response